MQRSPLQSLDDALAQLLAQAQPLTELDTLCTFEADGRVLAMTQDDTPAETVNKWYTKVFEEAV